MPARLAELGLVPSGNEPVPGGLFETAFAALAQEYGVLDPNAAYCAVGRSRMGSRLLALAVSGRQPAWNDHYPYCEAVFEIESNGNLRLLQRQRFWFDVSGLESLIPALPMAATAIALLLLAYRILRP
jgi:hypothetical protein